MRNGPSLAVLGFRPHTGWSVVVTLVGQPDAPLVIDRRRIEIGAAGEERFVYHRAAEVPRVRSGALIAEARAVAETKVAREIEHLLATLQQADVSVRAAAVPAAAAKLPDELEKILGAHSRIHAAEGNFYRDVVAEACKVAGLDVHRFPERELPALVRDLLPSQGLSLEARLKEMGKTLGPPWAEDQRLALLAAWIHLARISQT
jgi:hypothetical protein